MPKNKRPKGECYDCGRKYGGLGWADILVASDIWREINPTEFEGAGLLCFCCMAKRCAALGLKDVPIAIGSGPFRVVSEEEMFVMDCEARMRLGLYIGPENRKRLARIKVKESQSNKKKEKNGE